MKIKPLNGYCVLSPVATDGGGMHIYKVVIRAALGKVSEDTYVLCPSLEGYTVGTLKVVKETDLVAVLDIHEGGEEHEVVFPKNFFKKLPKKKK